MTSIMRRQPSVLDLGDWMNRFFEDRGLLPEARWFGDKEVLRVEQFTEGGALVVRAELPGIDPDKDVSISIHDGMLHLKAERQETSEQRDKDQYRSEFRYGMFERTIPLPAGVTGKDVTATYKDGILDVRIPQPETAEASTVSVVRLP